MLLHPISVPYQYTPPPPTGHQPRRIVVYTAWDAPGVYFDQKKYMSRDRPHSCRTTPPQIPFVFSSKMRFGVNVILQVNLYVLQPTAPGSRIFFQGKRASQQPFQNSCVFSSKRHLGILGFTKWLYKILCGQPLPEFLIFFQGKRASQEPIGCFCVLYWTFRVNVLRLKHRLCCRPLVFASQSLVRAMYGFLCYASHRFHVAPDRGFSGSQTPLKRSMSLQSLCFSFIPSLKDDFLFGWPWFIKSSDMGIIWLRRQCQG